MRSVVALFVVATLLLASAAPVLAQVDSREGIALQNQIYQLRQELRGLQDQLARGGGGSSRPPAYAAPQQQSGGNELLAQLLTRVDALEEQVRQLRGRIDETQNQMQRHNDDLSKRIDDLAFQMSVPAGAKPAAGSTADYTAAEASAREVLSNRTSPRAYDARLLLAQALTGQRQYAQAAIAYDDTYNSSHKGNHAQDALLGLANSLTAINEKKAACDTLGRLRTEFPQPRADVATGATAAAQKAGCR